MSTNLASGGQRSGARQPPPVRPSASVPPRRARLLITLEALVAGSAVYGGVGLAFRNVIHMPDDWLAKSPFSSWVLPGILLLFVVAAPTGIAACLEIRRSRWAGIASVTAGASSIGWIAAELAVMQKYNLLQPVVLGLGVAIVLLALWTGRDEPLRPRGT